jgi:hypothetical protein
MFKSTPIFVSVLAVLVGVVVFQARRARLVAD